MKIKHVGKMTVAGHRGDCYNRYENTMTAFKYAFDTGADMIETDVRMSKDGVLVLMHDESVWRTTESVGNIKDMTLAQIKKLNAGDLLTPEEVPTFEEFMVWVKDTPMTVNIEIKEYYSEENKNRCVECIEKVLSLVEKLGMRERILINSFDAFVLEYVYNKYGKKYLLHGFYPYDIMTNVKGNPDEYLYCACIFQTRNKGLYDYLISRGIEPWIGASVTNPSMLDLAYRYGAKLITTNNPKDVIEKLKNLGLR